MKKVTVQIDKPEKEDWEKDGLILTWDRYEIYAHNSYTFYCVWINKFLVRKSTIDQAQEACWQHYLKHHNMEKVKWEKLRDKFFAELTDYIDQPNVRDLKKVNSTPHTVFEWFKQNLEITPE